MSTAAYIDAQIVIGAVTRRNPDLRVLRGGQKDSVAPQRKVQHVSFVESELLETAYVRLRPVETGVATRPLDEAINAARGILTLGNNWDGEGSPSYAETTLERAHAFLLAGTLQLWETRRVILPTPRVDAGPDGSIDLHWETNGREMLVNVPPEADETITFYGDDILTKVKGELTLDLDTTWLLLWLAR